MTNRIVPAPKWLRLVAVTLPTAVLSCVAITQMFQVATHPERPRWKHGGFGMYSEIYDARHFLRLDDSKPPASQAQFAAAVKEFKLLGAEERIDLLYEALNQHGVPIESVLVARKRLRIANDEYRIVYEPCAEFPSRHTGQPDAPPR